MHTIEVHIFKKIYMITHMIFHSCVEKAIVHYKGLDFKGL